MISQTWLSDDTAVPKLGEVDLDSAGVVGELRDLADLLAGELAQPRRYVDVLPAHDDVHQWTFSHTRRAAS